MFYSGDIADRLLPAYTVFLGRTPILQDKDDVYDKIALFLTYYALWLLSIRPVLLVFFLNL